MGSFKQIQIVMRLQIRMGIRWFNVKAAAEYSLREIRAVESERIRAIVIITLGYSLLFSRPVISLIIGLHLFPC